MVAVQRGSLRERAAFVVLSQTLLQGLGDMSETQHLHTAQSVYSLLEPAILELTQKDMPTVRGSGGLYNYINDRCLL